ncbi:ankyrin repeat domain-containing protein, partial [archaeon]
MRQGANVEAVDWNSWRPIHWACLSGSVACLRVLLEAGADMEAADQRRMTPLHVACEEDQVECAR